MISAVGANWRGAERDIVSSRDLDDDPDRVHNDLWSVNLHDVARPFSDA
jgi:hypothetical protein